MLDVVSLGEPMLEFCASSVGKLKDVTTFERGWGGDTSNMIVAVARLGKKAGYITRVGDDEFGECFLDMWRKDGIDISQVIVEKGSFTGIYFIALSEAGEHEFTYYRKGSAATHLSPGDIEEAYIKNTRIFHSSGISQAISESSREAVFKAIEAVKKADGAVSYDPNIRLKLWSIHTAKPIVTYTLQFVDIITPSLEDAKLITGLNSYEEIAETLMKMGPRIVALKMGSQGCFVANQRHRQFVKAYEVKNVVDTTGAGDVFTGAFLVGLLEGWDIVKAAKFANAAAALKTLGRGAVAPIPIRKKVEEFLSLHDSKFWSAS